MYALIFFAFLVLFIIWGTRKEKKNPAWIKLIEGFLDTNLDKTSLKMHNDVLYFWSKDQNNSPYWNNGVIVQITADGLKIKHPFISKWYLKPLFFKWSEIKIEGMRKHWFRERVVISNIKNDVLFSLSKKFEDELKQRIEPVLIEENKDN